MMSRLQSLRQSGDIIRPFPSIEYHSQSLRISGPELRHSHSHRTFDLELRDIIRVYPDKDCHCVGSIKSGKRRCKRPTSRESQSKACALLVRGTRMMEAGQSIDQLLEEVALLVLCKFANHKDQAPKVVAGWIQDISSYQATRSTELAFLELGDTIERLVHRYHGIISQNQRNVPTIAVPAPGPEQRGSRSGRPSTRNRHTASPSRARMETRPPRVSEETSRQSTREPTRRAERNSHSSSGRTASEQGSPLPIRARSQSNPRGRTTSRNVSRQTIEGECSICLDLLLDDGSSEDRIAWCANSCGNNFHRDCLNEWIRRGDSPRNSCPVCRHTENTWAD